MHARLWPDSSLGVRNLSEIVNANAVLQAPSDQDGQQTKVECGSFSVQCWEGQPICAVSSSSWIVASTCGLCSSGTRQDQCTTAVGSRGIHHAQVSTAARTYLCVLHNIGAGVSTVIANFYPCTVSWCTKPVGRFGSSVTDAFVACLLERCLWFPLAQRPFLRCPVIFRTCRVCEQGKEAGTLLVALR